MTKLEIMYGKAIIASMVSNGKPLWVRYLLRFKWKALGCVVKLSYILRGITKDITK